MKQKHSIFPLVFITSWCQPVRTNHKIRPAQSKRNSLVLYPCNFQAKKVVPISNITKNKSSHRAIGFLLAIPEITPTHKQRKSTAPREACSAVVISYPQRFVRNPVCLAVCLQSMDLLDSLAFWNIASFGSISGYVSLRMKRAGLSFLLCFFCYIRLLRLDVMVGDELTRSCR